MTDKAQEQEKKGPGRPKKSMYLTMNKYLEWLNYSVVLKKLHIF